jgi:competence protein ComEA
MRVEKGVVAMQSANLRLSKNRRSATMVAVLALAACTSFASAQGPGPAAGVPPPQATHPHSTELPPGAGKDTVMRVCSKCHSPNILVANPRDRQGWEDTITKMSGLGAMATDDEFTEILEYLAKNVTPTSAPAATTTAKVNVNKATSAEMVTSLSLTAKDADAVVAYRTKNGDFKSIDDLKKVPDVDAKKIDDSKDKLDF